MHININANADSCRLLAAQWLNSSASLDKNSFKQHNVSATTDVASGARCTCLIFGAHVSCSSLASWNVTELALLHPAELPAITTALAFRAAPCFTSLGKWARQLPCFACLATVWYFARLPSLGWHRSHSKSTVQIRARQGFSSRKMSTTQSQASREDCTCITVHLLMTGGPQVLAFKGSDQSDQPAILPVRSLSMCSTPGLRQPNAASQTMNDVEVKEVSLLGTLWASSGEEGWRKITKSLAADHVEKSDDSRTWASQRLIGPPEGSSWSQKTRISKGPRCASKSRGVAGR